jgi:hypothetical protein
MAARAMARATENAARSSVSWPYPGGGPMTPMPNSSWDQQQYFWRDPREPAPMVKPVDQPIPASATGLLPYDRANLRTRAKLNRTPHVVASGGWAAAA